MKEDGADTLNVGAPFTVPPNIAKQCAQLGYKPLQIGPASTFANSWLSTAELDGALLQGANANFLDTGLPAVKDFQDAMEKYYPGKLRSEQFSWAAYNPWIGGQMFAAAVKAGDLTPESTSDDIKDALYSFKDETLGGLAPPLNFVKDQPGFPTCYFPLKISGGELTSASEELACLSDDQAGALMSALAAG